MRLPIAGNLASLETLLSLARSFAYYTRAILQLELRGNCQTRSLANFEDAGLQLPGLTHEREHNPP